MKRYEIKKIALIIVVIAIACVNISCGNSNNSEVNSSKKEALNVSLSNEPWLMTYTEKKDSTGKKYALIFSEESVAELRKRNPDDITYEELVKIRDDTVALFQKYTKFVFPNTSDAFFGSDGSAIYVARSNSDVLYLHNELYNEADSITFDNDDLIIDFSLTGDEENPVSDGHKYMDLAKAVFIRMMYYINSTKFDNKILPGAGGLKTMIYCTKDGEKNIDVARITYAYGCILYYEKGQPDENTQGIQLFGIEDFF